MWCELHYICHCIKLGIKGLIFFSFNWLKSIISVSCGLFCFKISFILHKSDISIELLLFLRHQSATNIQKQSDALCLTAVLFSLWTLILTDSADWTEAFTQSVDDFSLRQGAVHNFILTFIVHACVSDSFSSSYRQSI